MLYVDRSLVPHPSALNPDVVEPALEALREQRDAGQRLKFSNLFHGARGDLERLFSGKCAYCETPVRDVDPWDIDHFRPRNDAIDLRGNVSDGYWWLAYEWSNLYLACQRCNSSKRSRFPIRGKRAQPGEDLEIEGALLLDPCNAADFEEPHLVFSTDPDGPEDGMVAAATRRGEITIDVLSLNRRDLREARAQHAAQLYQETREAWDGPVEDEWERVVDRWVANDAPFVSMTLQLLGAWYGDFTPIQEQLAKSAEPTLQMTKRRRDGVVDRYSAKQAKVQRVGVSTAVEPDQAHLIATVRRIECVRISNFRAINSLELEFPPPISKGETNEGEGWLTLLGENGTGKSSVLQAIALALVGDEERSGIVRTTRQARPESVLRRGADRGFVEVRLSNLDDPVRLEFSRDRYESNYPTSPVVLLGYGSTRLLRTAGDSISKDTTGLVHLDNLFDPFARLNNVERWAADTALVGSDRFRDISEALGDLLQLEDTGGELFRRNGRIKINHGDRTETLDETSSGYSSVIALALDMMMVLSQRWKGKGSIRNAEGVVLIDEIGVHLHPRWQMGIVTRLRNVFRNIQFIVSTHQPLCLQGLHDREVVLMDRVGGAVTAFTDLPSPEGLRAEQLLTSPFFGLRTTVSPDVEALFNEYYALLGQHDLSSAQRERLNELKEQLRDQRHLGDSLRDELMYEVIDRLLVEGPSSEPSEDLPALKDSAVQQVSEVWSKQLSRMQETES